MKIRISDMMDHAGAMPFEIRERDILPPERVSAAVMRKIRARQPAARVRRKATAAGLAAAVAAGLCITASAAVAFKWNGFAATGQMSAAEKGALLSEAHTGVSNEYIDKEGIVHYLDENGEETMALTEDEALAYEQARQESADKAVAESTALVNAHTIPLMPRLITEVAVDKEGRFEECALGNGCMILLHPEGETGFALSGGEAATIELEADEECLLGFGQFIDGVFAGEQTVSARRHSYRFTAEESGVYCFYVEYLSAGASILSGGTITIS